MINTQQRRKFPKGHLAWYMWDRMLKLISTWQLRQKRMTRDPVWRRKQLYLSKQLSIGKNSIAFEWDSQYSSTLLFWRAQEINANGNKFLGKRSYLLYKTIQKVFPEMCPTNCRVDAEYSGEYPSEVKYSITLRSVLHRDIKPENILTGRDNDSNLYLVDFGISKFYRDKKGRHINFSENKPFLGTSRYASLGAHKGQELSRRDDLESLGYVLIYLLKGSLPWQVLKLQDEQKIKAVGDMKNTIPLNELCSGLPNEFERMIDYARKLDFRATPDYKFLRQMFQKLAHSQNIQDQLRYDWDFTPSSLQVPSSEIAVLKRSRRTTDQEPQDLLQNRKKQASSSTLNGVDGLSGHSFLKTPEQKCRKISLTPAKQKSQSSFNDSFSSCNQSANQTVIGMPSHQNNLSQLSFFEDNNLLALALESMSKVTKEQLNQEEHEENNGELSPSPLEVKYLKLKNQSVHVHFKRTLLQLESMNILPPQSSFNQCQ